MRQVHDQIRTALAIAVAFVSPWAFVRGALAEDRPNILWVSVEDMDPDLMPYGNEFARTPVLNELAATGLMFDQAYATAPVCSPSRSGIFFGYYQTSLGLGNHRAKVPTPEGLRGFPALLREAGYFTTNHTKTDINSTSERSLIRDAFDRGDDWRDRPDESTPFFSIINLNTTHASRSTVWERSRFEQEVGSKLPDGLRSDPEAVPVLPYHAGTDAARSDIARYYDCIARMDQEVGEILERLEEDGLSDSTIVFFFSDHGAALPRHKGTALETGLRVPLIVRVPERWRALTGFVDPERIDFPVSLVDLGPTVLSLAGVDVPADMHGTSLFPKLARQGRAQFVFGARDRCDERIDAQRSVMDGRFVYLRNLMPQVPHSQPHHYQRNSVLRVETARLVASGALLGPAAELSQTREPEELYDLDADPHQLVNLAANSEFVDVRQRMRAAINAQLKYRGDINLIPEPEMIRLCAELGVSPAELKGQSDAIPFEEIHRAALLSGFGWPALTDQIDLSRHESPSVRYWAAIGLYHQDPQHGDVIETLGRLSSDDSPLVQAAAAWAIAAGGRIDDAEPVFRRVLMTDDSLTAEFAARAIQLLGPAARGLQPDVIEAGERLGSGRISRIAALFE